MSIQVGQQAPSFSLYNSEKEQIALADFAGQNVLLLFYPLAFTGTCTTELCTVRDNLAAYNELDTTVLAVSVDTLFSLAQFKAAQNLNFHLLSDFNKEVSTAYGVLHEKFAFGMKGVAKRSAFVIDKDGVIQYAEVLEDPTHLPDFNAIQAALAQVA